jgi:glycosyltransferase involved in cell wall biosynthesis
MIEYEKKPKIVIITQAVDSSNVALGFFLEWVKRFAGRCEKVFVICLNEGEHDLPPNVVVYPLRQKKLERMADFRAAMLEIIEDHQADLVFAHMCPIYAIASSWFTVPVGKPVTLWYAAGKSNKIKIATALSKRVYSCSKSSYPIKTKKLEVVGHGIDTEMFKPAAGPGRGPNEIRIVSTGRITPIKNYEITIEAIDIIRKNHPELGPKYRIVGGPFLEEDKIYLNRLKTMVDELGLNSDVEFSGTVPYSEMAAHYHWCDLSTNMTVNMGMDKTVLEAMACARPVITTNSNCAETLGEFCDMMLAKENDPHDMAEKILAIHRLGKSRYDEIGGRLREIIVDNHSLDRFIDRLFESFAELCQGRRK